jgi:hypothetical protein
MREGVQEGNSARALPDLQFLAALRLLPAPAVTTTAKFAGIAGYRLFIFPCQNTPRNLDSVG